LFIRPSMSIYEDTSMACASRVQHSPSKDFHKTLAIMMNVFSAPIVLYFIDQLKNFDKIHPCVIFVTVIHSIDIAHVTRA
jgi:hypothetical protein